MSTTAPQIAKIDQQIAADIDLEIEHLEERLLELAKKEIIAKGFLKNLRDQKKCVEEDLIKLMNEKRMDLLQLMIACEQEDL